MFKKKLNLWNKITHSKKKKKLHNSWEIEGGSYKTLFILLIYKPNILLLRKKKRKIETWKCMFELLWFDVGYHTNIKSGYVQDVVNG